MPNEHKMGTFLVYYRNDCHLCEDMLEQLQPLIIKNNLNLDLIDIDRSEELQKKYGSIIPVLSYQDEDKQVELCKYFFDEDIFNAVIVHKMARAKVLL